MKRLLTFAVLALAIGLLLALPVGVQCEDCPPGQVFEPDGGQYCTWLLIDGQWQFLCSPTGECISACYPYECADLNRSARTARKPRGE